MVVEMSLSVLIRSDHLEGGEISTSSMVSQWKLAE